MIKLAVFDWNGTIFADIALTVAATNAEFAVVGHPALTIAQVRRDFEIPLSKYYENVGVSLEQRTLHAAAMHAAFHDHYEKYELRVRTRAGARQVLHRLHDKAIDRIILSNHHVKGITKQLQRLRLDHHFEVVLANDDIHGAMTMGKSERLVRYLEQHHYDPAEVFIIGDTTEEVTIGKSLGLKTVAITGGMNSRTRLEAAKPDVLISSLHDLIDVVEEWNNE